MFFLELSCFFDDLADVGNLTFGSSAFSKTNLNIWNFTVHILQKPGLENFEHYSTSVSDECSSAVVSTFFGIAFYLTQIQRKMFCNSLKQHKIVGMQFFTGVVKTNFHQVSILIAIIFIQAWTTKSTEIKLLTLYMFLVAVTDTGVIYAQSLF